MDSPHPLNHSDRKILILFLSILLFSISCTRSQFSTTKREYRNGKTTYSHRHPAERERSAGHRSVKILQHAEEVSIRTPASEIKKQKILLSKNLNPVTDRHPEIEYLLASTSENSAKIALTKKRIDPPDNRIILKKNTEKPPSRSESLHSHAYPVDVKALLGFIFSILGWIPIIGLFFSIAAIILSIISLYQFDRGTHNGARSGKWLAIAGLALGFLAFIFNIIFLIGAIPIMDFSISGLAW